MRHFLLTFIVLITACSPTGFEEEYEVMSVRDKVLTCGELRNELSEADRYRETALKNQEFKAFKLLVPVEYTYQYLDANEAISAAEERIQYLNRIYDISDCDHPSTYREEHNQMIKEGRDLQKLRQQSWGGGGWYY